MSSPQSLERAREWREKFERHNLNGWLFSGNHVLGAMFDASLAALIDSVRAEERAICEAKLLAERQK